MGRLQTKFGIYCICVRKHLSFGFNFKLFNTATTKSTQKALDLGFISVSDNDYEKSEYFMLHMKFLFVHKINIWLCTITIMMLQSAHCFLPSSNQIIFVNNPKNAGIRNCFEKSTAKGLQ